MEEFDEKTKELAWTAYHAYGEDADWTNFTGSCMPSWFDLPDETKQHWYAAVKAILLSLPEAGHIAK